MFKYLEMSPINKDGIEHICAKVDPFKLDGDGLAYGKTISLINDHAKNTYEIREGRLFHGTGSFIRIIQKGKDETIGIEEFKRWLIDNDYSDEEFINAMRNTYKDAYEKYYS